MTARCEPPEEWRSQDGWHFLICPALAQPEPARWLLTQEWHMMGDIFSPEHLSWAQWRYIAPVLTPAEISEREAAAYQRGQRDRQTAVDLVLNRWAFAPDALVYHTDGAAKADGWIMALGYIRDAVAALPIKEKPE